MIEIWGPQMGPDDSHLGAGKSGPSVTTKTTKTYVVYEENYHRHGGDLVSDVNVKEAIHSLDDLTLIGLSL